MARPGGLLGPQVWSQQQRPREVEEAALGWWPKREKYYQSPNDYPQQTPAAGGEGWSLTSLHSPALSNSVGIQVRAGRFATSVLFFLTHWAHVAWLGDTGEPSAACNILQHDKCDGDQWWAGLHLLGRNTLTAVRYQDDIPLSDHMLLRWAWVPSRVCQCPGLLHRFFSMNYTVYCSR